MRLNGRTEATTEARAEAKAEARAARGRAVGGRLKALALGLTALALGLTGTVATTAPAAAASSLILTGPSLTGDESAELIKKEDGFRIWENTDGYAWDWPWGEDWVHGSGWSGADPRGVYFADLNGDRHKDLINLSGDSFRVWHHNQNSLRWNPWGDEFRTGSGWSGHDPSSIWFADITGDGLADLVEKSGDTLSYYRNLGGGTSWADAVTMGHGYAGRDPRSLWFADLNGDQKAERIELSQGSFLVAPNTLGHTGGWPWGATSYYTGSGWSGHDPSGIWFADITGDGRADLVQKNGDALRYFPNSGSGTGGTSWSGAVHAGSGWSSVDPKGIYFA
ncbi:FG-GAP repeat domain-containing protein [Streptomyces sp. NPDC127092]|uniref:FG-GAP repeat domain-containing protein n=1 Tax=Streptomyces sp. NPDC127092 TaxID=3347135 RepID=UPI00365357DE